MQNIHQEMLNFQMKSLTDMGNKAMQIKDYKDAIKHYDEALEIDDKNVEVLNARILAFIEMKDFKMAHKDAEYWVSLDSDSAEVKAKRSSCLQSIEMYTLRKF